jgi:membrane-associated phospholipid phosphatase
MPIEFPAESNARRMPWLAACCWCAAMALAFGVDAPLASWLRTSGTAQMVKDAPFWHLVKHAGLYHFFTIPVAVALGVSHPMRWRASLFEMACGVIASLSSVTKFAAGRFRPFKILPYDQAQPFYFSPFAGGIHGVIHPVSDLSFVSGHTALAFATAAGVGALVRSTRGRVWVYCAYAVAILVLMERVGENAHWCSDAVCAAAMGCWGVRWFARAVNVGHGAGPCRPDRVRS